MSEINTNTPMHEMTIGGNIYEAGNARNFIDELGHVKEFQIWTIFTENNKHLFDGSLRSKKATINDIARNYQGGGHKNASGVKNLTMEDIDSILADFQSRLKEV